MRNQADGLYNSMLNAVPHAIIGLHEHRIVFASDATEAVFGWKPEELIGKTARVLYRTEEEYEKIAGYFYSALERQQTYIEEFPCRHKDGRDIVCMISASRIGESLKEREIVVTFEDISGRKQAEESLRKSEGKYRSLVNNIKLGIFRRTMGPAGRFLEVNPAMEEITGYSRADLLRMNVSDLHVHPEEREAILEEIATGVGTPAGELNLRKKDGTEIVVSNTKVAVRDDTGQVLYFDGIIEDITERKKAEEQLERSFIDLAETVSRAMAARDLYTAGHQQRVAKLARLVGEKMGLDANRLMGLYIGGLLHDIGKVSTPESILSKPGKLSDEEWALVRAHAREGYKIVDGTYFPWPVAEMALHHHERVDGSGYPNGISGDKLSLEVRILAVCDVVEAMSSFRPYRPARSKEEVLNEIKGGRGTKYDPDVVDMVLQIIENGEFVV